MNFENILTKIRTEAGDLTIIGVVFYGIIIFIFIHIILKFLNIAINRSLEKHKGEKGYSRIVTIMELVKKVVKVFLYIIAVLMILEMLNINTSAILATAGIGSLAIGMGAQSLIKDVINGFFIIFENQYSVGDFIETAGKSGHVEDVGLRITKVRDNDGTLHFIPNSEVRIVTNRDRGLVRALVEIPVDEKEDVDRVLTIFDRAMEPLRVEGRPELGPTLWGVTDNFHDGYTITIVGLRKSGEHYDLDYAIRRAIIKAMEEYKIAMPLSRIRRGDLDHEETVL